MIAEIRALNLLGRNDRQIGSELGLSISRICRLRHRAGIPTVPRKPSSHLDRARARRLYERRLNDRQIARQLRVSRELIQKWRAANHLAPNGWTCWNQKAAFPLYLKGLNDRQIGIRLGVKDKQVQRWRTIHGLPPQVVGRPKKGLKPLAGLG